MYLLLYIGQFSFLRNNYKIVNIFASNYIFSISYTTTEKGLLLHCQKCVDNNWYRTSLQWVGRLTLIEQREHVKMKTVSITV